MHDVSGQYEQAFEQAGQQGDGHQLGHVGKQTADSAPDEHDRKKRQDGGQRRGAHRREHLADTPNDRLAPRASGLHVAVDVLQHHDRVVDDQAADQHHREHGGRVGGDVQCAHADRRAEKGEGNPHHRQDAVADAQGNPQHDQHEHATGQQVLHHHAERVGHPGSDVHGHGQSDALERLLCLVPVDQPQDSVPDHHDVRTGSLRHLDHDAAVSPVARADEILCQPFLEPGNVFQVNVGAARVLADDDVAQVVQSLRMADEPDRVFLLVGRDRADGDGEYRPANDPGDQGGRQSRVFQLLAIQQHADFPLALAQQPHLSHPGHVGKLVPELPGHLANCHRATVSRVRDAKPQERGVLVQLESADDRGLAALGQVRNLVDPRLQGGKGRIHFRSAGLAVKPNHHPRQVRRALASVPTDVADRLDLPLDLLGDELLHLFGRRPRPNGQGHGARGGDFRVDLDGQAKPGHDSDAAENQE